MKNTNRTSDRSADQRTKADVAPGNPEPKKTELKNAELEDAEDEASEESFPASDPPARVATTGSQVKTDGRRGREKP